MGGPPAVADPLRQAAPGARPERARVAEEARLVAEYDAAFINPYRAAELGVVDAVIDPGETRRVLCDALEVLSTKRDAATTPAALQHAALTAREGLHAARSRSASWSPAC